MWLLLVAATSARRNHLRLAFSVANQFSVPMRATAFLAAAAIVLTACGGGASETDTATSPGFVEQGVTVAEDDVIPTTTTVAPVEGAVGASEGVVDDDSTADPDANPTGTTLPQNEQSQEENVDDLFVAMRTFNSCLEERGRPFIGFDANAPEDDPRNDPSYLEALGDCAAISRIQDALAAADLGSEGKTPEEIEEQNRGLIRFQTCLRGRGWNVVDPVPDENGLLEFGDLGAPDGENILESDDLNECRGEATADEDE
ncbi:MAG: hypothetical protein ACI9C1_001542 [Candidatus Aldehydirespiratoraceae bacterium]|jgi:hypothetical protein